MSGFEGSYAGDRTRISERAVMECKICWYCYDPAQGDDTRQVSAGTAFYALPQDWSCPQCDADASHFLVKHDPGSDIQALQPYVDEKARALVADFQEIYNAKMKDVPIINHALHVELVGFKVYENRLMGVLISPWFMNLIEVPMPGEEFLDMKVGEKEVQSFPSGQYEFIYNMRELTGPYKACSLFSPMDEFSSQLQAKEVASAVMIEIFNNENMAETDRRQDIEALAKERETCEETAEPTPIASSRRDILRGDFSPEKALENE